MRGSQEAFTELLRNNVSLLRRPFGVYLLLAAASLLLQAKKGGKA